MTYLYSGSGSKQTKIQILFEDDHIKPKQKVERNKKQIEIVQFSPDDKIEGKVYIEMSNPKKTLPYTKITLELISTIEITNTKPHTLLTKQIELSNGGTISYQKLMFPFDFSTLNQYESYSGKYVKLRYFLRLTIYTKTPLPSVEQEFALIVPQIPQLIQPIQTQMGIENLIHLDLELNKNSYALDEVLLGSIFLRLLHFKINKIELQIIRSELVGRPLVEKNRTVVHSIQLSDGQLVKGDVLPIRLFLKYIPLSATLQNVADSFSVNYYLSFDFFDEEGMKYSSLVEVNLYRRKEKNGDVDVRMVPPINIVNFEQLQDPNVLYLVENESKFENENQIKIDDDLPTFGDVTINNNENEVVEEEIKEEDEVKVEEEVKKEEVKEEIKEEEEKVVEEEEKKHSSSSSSSSSDEDKNKNVHENNIDDFIF